MSRRRILAMLAGGAALAGLLATTARSAVQGDVERRAAALAHELMSPFCPQLLLADCRSEPAAELRAEIRDALAHGASESDIRTRLTRRFGERILAAPPAQGFGLFAWLTPPVVVCAAAVLVAGRLRPSVRSGEPPMLSDRATDALRARLEDELRRA